MKIFLTSFFVFAGCMTSPGQTLTITVHNVRNGEGSVGVALYNTENDFMKKHVQANAVPAKEGTVTIMLEHVAEGEYALTLLHDANNNGKMDTNSFGIPKEGYGFSNNVMGVMGPPSFGKAKFTMGKNNREISVKMKYF